MTAEIRQRDPSLASSFVRRVARSGSWFTLAFAAGTGASLVTAVVVARAAGPEGFGHYTYYQWLIRLASVLGVLGLPAMLARFTAHYLGEADRSRVKAVFGLAVRSGLVLTSVACAVVALHILGRGDGAWLAGLAAAAIAVAATGVLLEGFLSGTRDFRAVAAVSGLGGALHIVIVLLMAYLGASWQSFVLALAAAGLLPLAVYTRLYRRGFGGIPVVRLEREDSAAALRFAFMLALTSLAGEIVWGRPEIYFLERWHGAAAVGVYGAALRLSTIVMLLPGLSPRVLMPELSYTSSAEGSASLGAHYRSVCTLVAFVAVPLAIGGYSIAPELIRTIFGIEYAGAATAARILMLGGLAGGVAAPATAAVMAAPRAGAIATVALGFALANVALDVALIPVLGLAGAALATVISQSLGAVAIIAVAARRGLRYPATDLARLTMAGLACAAAAKLALSAAGGGPAGLALAILAGGVAYLAAGHAIGPVKIGDLAAILSRSATRE